MQRTRVPMLAILALIVAGWAPPVRSEPSPVRANVEAIVARMREAMDEGQMMAIDEAGLQRFITPEDREALATRYWSFDVNVPVVVSVMRDVRQAAPPFWLAERGFRKTDLRVRNEEYEYEVWQRTFPAGRVGLGISGFENHRPHYFVSVGPQNPGDRVQVTALEPAGTLGRVQLGALTYHDWTELVLTQAPEAIRGHVLLQTIRGRSRESHIVGGFRKTPFPSSTPPDEVTLTWSADPCTTQTVQWRCSAKAGAGAVRWQPVTAGPRDPWRSTPAASEVLSDSRIVNDPTVHHYTATLRGLAPGTSYRYSVGSVGGLWSACAVFRTAPARPEPASFLWLSDTHSNRATRNLLAKATALYPNARFCLVSGDLVGTGQYRDDWDQFLTYTGAFAQKHPLLPAIGNHDCIDGLGADLYLSLFGLPANGSTGAAPERTYTVRYGDVQIIVLDSSGTIEAQTAWLAKTLKASTARWKVAMFHFPPYSPDEDYPDIRREWCTLFDRYHVDLVLSGHVHTLQRTYPLRAGKRTAPGQGTVYLITVSVPQRRGGGGALPPYAVVATQPGTPVVHAFSVDGGRMTVRAHGLDGAVLDQVVIAKPGAGGAR